MPERDLRRASSAALDRRGQSNQPICWLSSSPRAADRRRRRRRDSAGRGACGRVLRDGRRRARGAARRRRRRRRARSPRGPRAAPPSHGASPGSMCPPGCSQIPSDLWCNSMTPRGPVTIRRSGDVDRVGGLVEGSLESVETGEELGDAAPLGDRRSADWLATLRRTCSRNASESLPDDWSPFTRTRVTRRNRDKSLELRLRDRRYQGTHRRTSGRTTPHTDAWNPTRNSHPECCWRSTISVSGAPTKPASARPGSRSAPRGMPMRLRSSPSRSHRTCSSSTRR